MGFIGTSNLLDLDEFESLFREQLHAVVNDAIDRCGGYDDELVSIFLHEGYYKRLKKVFKEVEEETIRRFHTENKKRSFWPFTDKKLSPKGNFKGIYMLLEAFILNRNKRADNEEIERAGGRPFSYEKYSDKSFGDAVTRPDVQAIASELGISDKTVYRTIKKLVSVGVLIPLKTRANEKSLYKIGVWKGHYDNKTGGGINLNRIINRMDLRKGFTKDLVDAGLIG